MAGIVKINNRFYVREDNTATGFGVSLRELTGNEAVQLMINGALVLEATVTGLSVTL